MKEGIGSRKKEERRSTLRAGKMDKEIESARFAYRHNPS
jgi:hypothetical protein